MPGMSGLDLQEALRNRGISLPVVVLTAHGDVATTRLAMKNGAFDFLEKPVDNEILLDVLQSAIREDTRRHDAHRSEDIARSRLERLTPRERDVLNLLGDGLSQREIAGRLEISPRTVEMHRAHIMKKMEAASLSALVRAALAAEHSGEA